MGWNGSDRKGTAPVQPKVTAKKPSPVRGLIAGGLVIILAVVAYFAFFFGSEKPQNDEVGKKSAKIKEVAPAAAPTNKVAATTAAPTNKPAIKTYRDARGILRYEGGARVPNPKDFENPTRIVSRSTLPKFDHRVETEIATLLTVRPGGILAGAVRYNGFEQDFINSLADKIEFTEEDTPRQREIKQAVIDCKKELAERVAAGENIVDILKNTRKELQRLSAYKYEIDSLLREQLKDQNLTDDDVRLAYDAANKMLEQKGIAPINANGVIRRRHIMQQRIEAAKQAGGASADDKK